MVLLIASIVYCFNSWYYTGIIGQTKDQTKYYVAKSSHSLNHEFEDESALDKFKKEIEGSQENALGLCTEKVLLARQAYDLVSFFTA